jgi:2,4-dienoyl-CoA reductase-like NADH-dependent reductase (Old Yellow Enzyme family)
VEIADIVAGYAAAARRIREAGIDGVEIVASHGYLPAQFLNPRLNLREDGYGGDVLAGCAFCAKWWRLSAPQWMPTAWWGCAFLPVSATARTAGRRSLAACVAVQDQLDYVSLVAGTSASLGGAVHIAPPMAFPAAYLASRPPASARPVHSADAGRPHQPAAGGRTTAGAGWWTPAA